MNNTPAHSVDKLLVAMELSNSKWLLAFHAGDKIRRKSIDARDRVRFLRELALAKQKLGLAPHWDRGPGKEAVGCIVEIRRVRGSARRSDRIVESKFNPSL